jgi:hypothetical protein
VKYLKYLHSYDWSKRGKKGVKIQVSSAKLETLFGMNEVE